MKHINIQALPLLVGLIFFLSSCSTYHHRKEHTVSDTSALTAMHDSIVSLYQYSSITGSADNIQIHQITYDPTHLDATGSPMVVQVTNTTIQHSDSTITETAASTTQVTDTISVSQTHTDTDLETETKVKTHSPMEYITTFLTLAILILLMFSIARKTLQ